jgi:hypothetical protein
MGLKPLLALGAAPVFALPGPPVREITPAGPLEEPRLADASPAPVLGLYGRRQRRALTGVGNEMLRMRVNCPPPASTFSQSGGRSSGPGVQRRLAGAAACGTRSHEDATSPAPGAAAF